MGLWIYCIAAGVSTAIILYLSEQFRYRYTARKNGCAPARKYSHKDPFLGLDLFLQAAKMFSENTFFPTTLERYRKYGSTFQVSTLGTPTICTIDPSNIEVIFASQARNWGVEYRLPALDPYCGKGFLTTNGAEWEQSRALFSNSFQKANIKDHVTYERYVKLLIQQIPRDGSEVDIQLLIFALVRTATKTSRMASKTELVNTVSRHFNSMALR